MTIKTLTDSMCLLLRHPGQWIELEIKTPQPFWKTFGPVLFYWGVVSILFTVDVHLSVPSQAHFTSQEKIIRIFYFFLLWFILVVPFFTVLWATLQKFSAWFMNAPLQWRQAFQISGAGMLYFVLMYFISIPLILLEPHAPFIFQELLFLDLLFACCLSIHLFKEAYRILAEFPNRRALYTACLPILLVLLVIAATWALSYFAAVHHVG